MKSPDVPVLVYRKIATVLREPHEISKEEVIRQWDYLKKNQYTCIGMPQLARFVEKNENLPSKPFAIAFEARDDFTIKEALALLERFEFKATFFLPQPAWIEADSISSQGHTLGILQEMPLKEDGNLGDFLYDLSRRFREKTSLPPRFLSYSADPVTDEIRHRIRVAGFWGALCSRELKNNTFLTAMDLSRTTVLRQGGFSRFIASLNQNEISVCMITKNEENQIRDALGSINPIADEVIIVDTGSTDKTSDIARSLGARILSIRWTDDFSHARNISLQEAKKDWVLVIDADERLEMDQRIRIKQLANLDEYDAFSFMQRTYTNEAKDINFVALPPSERRDYPGYLASTIVRMFRNRKGYMFEGRVHESLDASLLAHKARIGHSEVPIHHYEIIKGLESIKQKQLAYMEYSKKQLADNPNDYKALCDIALIMSKYKSDNDDALNYVDKAIAAFPDEPRAFGIRAEILVRMGKYSEAKEIYTRLSQLDKDRSRLWRENMRALEN